MTPYEQMAKYEIGLEMDLFSLDELRRFLSGQLRGEDIPYIYTAVFLTLDKGKAEVVDTIFYNLQGNYTADRRVESPVWKALVGAMRAKWDCGQLSTARCVECLGRLNDFFDADWDCTSIGENYRLSQTGFYTADQFGAMLAKILLRGSV